MDKILHMLTSPIFWSTGVAFLAIVVGIRHYVAMIKAEDKAKEERRQQRALDNQNAE